jgi:hypothetical protein
MSRHIFQDEINASKAIKATTPPPKQQQFTFTAMPFQQGVGRNDIMQFDLETGAGLAGLRAAPGFDTSSQRRGLGNQLKFGLEGLGLSREGLGLDRESLALQQEGTGLDRRDALEGAINNALQRGIFRSGIRVRNERRVNERADLREEGFDIAGQRIDLQGRRLDLSEKELRANISNALAGLRSQAANAKRQQQMDFEQQRRQLRDQAILEAGGIFPSVGTEVAGPPGGGPRGGPR